MLARRVEIQQKVLNLFGIQKHPEDKRNVDFMMRAAYLDFYSKSLENPESENYLPYSSKLRIE